MKTVKSMVFLDVKEDPNQYDQGQIKNQFKQKINSSTDNLTQTSLSSQPNSDQILSKFKEGLPNSLSNMNNLPADIRQKLQKLLFWQQKQKALELKLQNMRQEKLKHLQNEQVQQRYFIIDTQRKTFQNFGNPAKTVSLQSQYSKLKQNQKLFESKTLKKVKFSSMNDLHYFKRANRQTQNMFQSQAWTRNISPESFEIKFCCISKNQTSKNEHYFSHFQFITKKNTKDLNCFGICDSHGDYAKELSDFFVKKISTILNEKKQKQVQFHQDSINQIFEQALINLYQSSVNIDKTGSSFNLCVIQNNVLNVLNIGDCRCIMGYKNLMNKWVVKFFMREHTLQNQRQAERIQKCGGLIKKSIQNGKQYGPLKIWDKKCQNYKPFGISITRSIGDMSLTQYGVSHLPQMISYPLNDSLSQGQRIIVIGSAGLYERLENKQIIQILSEFLEVGKTAKEASLQLIKKAYQKKKQINREQQGLVATVIFLS